MQNNQQESSYTENSEGTVEFLLLNGDAIGWGFPKGHVDKGENLVQTAKRETYEETSLKISKLEASNDNPLRKRSLTF